MKRFIVCFLLCLVSVSAPTYAAAQDSPSSLSHEEIITELLRILNEQDWTAVDAIMANDYAPLYATSDLQPGRDAWKQRQASSLVYQQVTDHQYTLLNLVSDGDVAHVFGEITGRFPNGNELRIPWLGLFYIRDGLIKGGFTASYDALFLEQMNG